MRQKPENTAGYGDETWDVGQGASPARGGQDPGPQLPTVGGTADERPMPSGTDDEARSSDSNSPPPNPGPSLPVCEPTAETIRRPPDSSFSAGADAARKTNPGTEAFNRGSTDWPASDQLVIEPGREVFGKFRLIKRIGAGAMGEVWLVEHLEMRDKRALKLIRPEISQNRQARRRFKNEAMLMAKLKHPNAVVVHDYGWRGGHAYIEMEFLRGSSIDKIIDDGTPRSLEWTAQFLDQLCAVLQEAHGFVDEETNVAHPIIHRDLKPSNMMFVEGRPPNQNLKVLDFGIAKIIGEEEQATLATEGFVGTAAYASPEQINGEKTIDGRSDLYSTGVILYKLLTGRLPFEGRGFAVLHQHLKEKPPRMSEANPIVKVPRAVEEVVNRCLEKDPHDRPQSAQELKALFHAAIGDPIASDPTTLLSAPRPKRKLGALPLSAIVGGVLLALTLVGLFAGFGRSGAKGRGGIEPIPPDRPTNGPVAAVRDPNAAKPATVSLGSVPAGYERVDPADLASEGPRLIKRIDDRVEFERYKLGVYLPVGYEPDSLAPNEKPRKDCEPWPQRLVRKTDKERRFIRIPGGVFFMGKPENEGSTDPNDPDRPHYVFVNGFYIQETEVTNGELIDYFNSTATVVPEPWKKYRNKLKMEPLEDPDIRQTAAAHVDHLFAEEYARRMGGRLPTEAEWEYAARSRGKSNEFAWDRLAPGKPQAHIEEDERLFPAKVKSMPDDMTEQGVFDMTGNVREWCSDPYRRYRAILDAEPGKNNDRDHPRLDRVLKVKGPREAAEFVARGGSFQYSQAHSNNYERNHHREVEQASFIGFRVVLECPPEVTSAKSPK